MEVIRQFAKNGVFGNDIYYYLLCDKNASTTLQMTPSMHIKEMKLSSCERMRKLWSSTSFISIDKFQTNGGREKNSVLEFSPRLLLFQNYAANDKITAKFQVKNVSQAAALINMDFKESTCFSVKPTSLRTPKLAPGISLTFTVLFAPTKYEDYCHSINFMTETDKYSIALIALGPRPLFDFPDEIVIPKTTLKIENSSTLTISNIGHISAGFSLTTRSPFSVVPKSVYLDPGDKIDITIYFISMHSGEFSGTLVASYETGESLHIALKATNYPAPIQLDHGILRFAETYVTMSRQNTILIHNHSSMPLSFTCMRYDSVETDFLNKFKIAHVYYNFKEYESQKCRKLVEYDILSCKNNERIYTRIFHDEIHALVPDEILFQDMHFTINPLKGKVWPHTSAELTILFSPKSIGPFTATAYLDVDGVTERLPFKMCGVSLPPSIKLNVETLDMDAIYVGRTYNYEIVAINNGHIGGVIAYKETPVLFASCITCTPEFVCLAPDEKKIFIISFLNNNKGPYFEEIQFIIRDSDITLKVYLKGEVVNPLLSLSTNILDFGKVSLGIPKTLEFNVVNESSVDIDAVVRVSSDGPEINSIPLIDYAVADIPKPKLPKWPKEFQIEPHKLHVDPNSKIIIKVTLTANLIRANQTSLEVEIKDAETAPFSVAITFDAAVPTITAPDDLLLKACFIDYPYYRDIVFSSNEFTGYFVLVTELSSPMVKASFKRTEGYIEPNSTTTIPVVLTTYTLGMQTVTVRMQLLGPSKPIHICQIIVCGVRPIITVSPVNMAWGHVKLLTKVTKSLTIVNDSPIPVNFEASMVNNDHNWSIDIDRARIPAESTFDVTLSLYLVDADIYQNKLLIRIDNMNDILVPLSAVGVGTSIVVGEFREYVILGRHFTKILMECQVVMENRGTRLHTLEWCPTYKQAKTKPVPQSFFNFDPTTFKMGASEKLPLRVTALTSKPSTMKEVWYLIGSVEGINKKELLMECPFEAEFVDPKIELSTYAIDLRYDFGPYSEHYNLTDTFTIKNVSTLPLDIDVCVKQPFVFVHRKSGYLIEQTDNNVCECICYNVSDLNIEELMRESEPYVCKQIIDYLTNKPVPPIRKDYLKFFQEINKLKVAFKLTQSANEVLQDQQAMRLQIIFDTTKHSTLRSREYCDHIKIKFRKHKNKDTLKVTGKINFPNLTVTPGKIDFGVIPNGSKLSKTLKIYNYTPLKVCYLFQWKDFCFIPESPAENSKSNEMSSIRKSCPSEITQDELHEILGFHEPSSNQMTSQQENEELLEQSTLVEKKKPTLLNTIFPILSDINDEAFNWSHKLPKTEPLKLPVHNLLHVIPHRGIIEPGECQYVDVCFSPKNYAKIQATLECNVLGGPAEIITISGASSDLKYALNPEEVNFRIRAYYEKATQDLKLVNSGSLNFDYVTRLDDNYTCKAHEAQILDITPTNKLLEYEDEVTIKVTIDPGILGYFHRSFWFEIPPQQVMSIDVFGWGVIPQVYFSLQKQLDLIPIEIGYRAIATLTPTFLAIVQSMFNVYSPHCSNSAEREQSEHKDTHGLDDPSEWYICSDSDDYPTIMDIELSIERLLVTDYIKNHPEALKNITQYKSGPINGFITTPYVIDYGVVIVGTTVTCCTNVVNYGPGPTKFYKAKYSTMPPWLEMKFVSKMNAGESPKCEITFSPISDYFIHAEEVVELTLHFEVPWGVTIPLIIKATCAVPYLTSNIKKINFGYVRCGDKVVCSIPIKNIGKCTCIWYATLKLKSAGANPLTILNSSGVYEPGEGGWLDIAFKPKLEMAYEGLLIFKFHMNPMKITIPVMGLGMLPTIRVIGDNIQFPPTLPDAPTQHLYFGLTNPCAFPIELIFAHTDEKSKEEDELYQILYKYYDKPEEMLVPIIEPGHGLPHEVMDFYKDLMLKVKSSQQEEDFIGRTTSARNNTVRKAPKRPIKLHGSRSTVRFRTQAEIISDELAMYKHLGLDPLKEAIYRAINKDNENKEPEDNAFGVLIFTHGSPHTEMEAMELACAIAKKLKLPLINIDNTIVEALSTRTTDCPARDALIDFINETYDIITKLPEDAAAIVTRSVEEQEQIEEAVEDEELDYDIIHKKLYAICTNKPQLATPRSKTNDKKPTKKSQSSSTGDVSETILPMDHLSHLLKMYLSSPRFNEGFVVDSLNSLVLRQAELALTTVLKCRPGVRDVQLIISHMQFAAWSAMYEERERDLELLAAEATRELNEVELEQLVQEFEDMNASDYENSSPELRNIYINTGLDDRRMKHFEKRTLPKLNHHAKKQGTQKGESTKSEIGLESKKKQKTNGVSSAASKKTDLKSAKMTSEYLLMNMRFNEYQKNTFDQLMNIATNWSIEDCDLAVPTMTLTGQLVGVPQKKGSGKKKTSDLELESALNVDKRGFPLMILTIPCLQNKEALVNIIAECHTIKAARTRKPQIDILKLPANCKNYTVLTPKLLPSISEVPCLQMKFLDEAPLKKCECNVIKNVGADVLSQENIIDILSMWHCTCGKNLGSTSTSTTQVPAVDQPLLEKDISEIYPRHLKSVHSISDLGQRIILEPGDLVRCKYSFSPQVEGKFNVKRYVEVAGWPESRVVVAAMGICDVPRLDMRPKKVFCDFVRRTVEDVIYKSVFLDDKKVFEFGPIFIGANRVYEEFTYFNLKNSSLMHCDISFSYLLDDNVFTVEVLHMNLEPGCKDMLKVLTAPSIVGEYTNTLVCRIKNNPKIVNVHVSCSGVTPHIELLPASKAIEYGKLLLYRREEQRFIVKNNSILPIKWKIRNPKDLVENFILGYTEGVIDRDNNQIVMVIYVASQVGVITNQPLVIDIYEQEGRGNPMLTNTLFLSAECYDVKVDCAFESMEDTSLDYGNVKVNTQIEKDMYFLNRGKYDIFYKIRKVKNFPEPSFLKAIEITEDCGIIPATMKMVNVSFLCTPRTRMDLQNVPAFECSFIDGTNNQTVVSKYPIHLSIASFYNTFTLFPLGELNFQVVPVGSISSREIIINNTSKCPFTYDIQVPELYQNSFSLTTVSKAPKDAKKGAAVPGLKCGNFTIMNEENFLAPGASRKVEVQFFSTQAIRFEEMIQFIVSDTCPSEAKGVPLLLVGTGAIPTLDIWNLETTFREHLIIKNITQYQVKETTPHCVFVEDSVTLHFFCVNVNSAHTANIDLFNNGLVPAALTMQLHYQNNSNSDIFYLDKYSTYVQPLVHRNLEVRFAPKALEEYRAILEIRLKLLQDQEDIYHICLIGTGIIPRIRILDPVFDMSKQSCIQFPATLMNSLSSKPVQMVNMSTVNSVVVMEVSQEPYDERPPFWLSVLDEATEGMVQAWNSEIYKDSLTLVLVPEATATVHICYTPSAKTKDICEVKLTIVNNPYEYFNIICDGEGFKEDITLNGIDMLPMDYEVELIDLEPLTGAGSTSPTESDKKSKTPSKEPKKNIKVDNKKAAKRGKGGDDSLQDLKETVMLKYILNLSGCHLNTLHKRTATFVNHSLRVYRFSWRIFDNLFVNPNVGFISPGEEKDIEICFLSSCVAVIDKITLCCNLTPLSSTMSLQQMNSFASDNQQTMTVFERSGERGVYARKDLVIEEIQPIGLESTEGHGIDMVIVFSATTDYAKYTCSLTEDVAMKDTLMYQKRSMDFEVCNIGVVPLKIVWSFSIDQHYPARIDSLEEYAEESFDEDDYERPQEETTSAETQECEEEEEGTLYSHEYARSSADTWFEAQLPFVIDPQTECIKAGDKQLFTITFAPEEAFNYKIRLNSFIEHLHPDYTNVSINIKGKSLVPYCHLDAHSDYVSSGRRKSSLASVPTDIHVLEFSVLGAGCYKKVVKIMNPTSEKYQFFLESLDKTEFIPVHCDIHEGFLESGSSMELCFTFAPSEPIVYESFWKILIPKYSIEMDLLVAGIVHEPDVSFNPTILNLNKTLVGSTTTKTVKLCNKEVERITYRFTGNSLCNESGKQPVLVSPEAGTVNPLSETDITIKYGPIVSGNLSFKIFCEISHMVKQLVLCVNAVSELVKPKVTYFLLHSEHELISDAITNIHIDKVASFYERNIRFVIKNEGSVRFTYTWQYVDSPIKKYMDISFDPREGNLEPGEEEESTMAITIRDIPVIGYPLTLNISDGPDYDLYLHADIFKPLYKFSFDEHDFGKCIINAPDGTYKKHLWFFNNDSTIVSIDLNFANRPELFLELHNSQVQPKHKIMIPVSFRPNNVKSYEFVLPFRINSLVEHNVRIKGEGVRLLIDLYEGCQKSIHLGAVKVGEKIVKEIAVINNSKVAVEAQFIFVDKYPNMDDASETDSKATSVCLNPDASNAMASMSAVKKQVITKSRVKMLKSDKDARVGEQLALDLTNALTSLKVTPEFAIIKPHHKIPLKIRFKPMGLIRNLNMQLCVKVFTVTKPIVNVSGQATGMSLCFSQNSLQFGSVRKHTYKTLRIMLFNKGDMSTRFVWQPLRDDNFSVSPMEGTSAARTTLTFSIVFKPKNNNPLIKTWIICNFDDHHPLELALYGSCLDLDNCETKTLKFNCAVRDVETIYANMSNQTDDLWTVLPLITGSAFETLTSFVVEPRSDFEVPISFKPKSMGQHIGNVLFSPLGENSMYYMLEGSSDAPLPNGICELEVVCKEAFTQELLVNNLTEFPETYIAQTEVMRVVPEAFNGYYEIKCPKKVKVWGEASAPCQWTIIVYDVCEMSLKVTFINQETREYQFYFIVVKVKPSPLAGTIELTTRARESVERKITLNNPLSQDIAFILNCSNEYLSFESQVVVSRKSEVQNTIVYSPLLVGEMDDFIEAGHPLVGIYVYKLLLTCLPAKEKTHVVSTGFGTAIPMRLRVHNKTDKPTDFTCTTTNTSLTGNKSYPVEPYEKAKLLTWFEPIKVGLQTGQIIFSSPTAGDFVYNIEGTATDPKPQGPIEIKLGSFEIITFKNVFEDKRTFKITVDHKNFSVKNTMEVALPKQEIKIKVFLEKAMTGSDEVVPAGCLTIACHELIDINVVWTYFLQGIP